jgi:glycerate-2-kinase
LNDLSDRDKAKNIFFVSLKAVDPYEVVKAHMEAVLQRYYTGGYNEVFLLAIGKASCRMAKAAEEALEGIDYRGGVITKYGHSEDFNSERLFLYEAGHPVPDLNGQKATEELLKFATHTGEKTLCLCLISGGGSALFVSPVEGITLQDKQEITEAMLRSGADIVELNTVRKHLSKVKGGRLAETLYPSYTITLLLSDVLKDRLDIIASGPTTPDPTSYRDAYEVLEKYGLIESAPERVLRVLDEGIKGLREETPKEDSHVFKKVENIIVGSNRIALYAAYKEADRLGLKPRILTDCLQGEARQAGRWLAEKAKEAKGVSEGPVCLISGGETTVTVRGGGKGGRNTELALSFALEIDGHEGITLLSAGTDGTDGPTDAAGAVVDSETVERARTRGLDPLRFLNDNDSYTFFQQTGELFITGPTGTNVMDIQIIIVR